MSRAQVEALQRLQKGLPLVVSDRPSNAKKMEHHLRICLENAGLIETVEGRLVVTDEGRRFIRCRGDWKRIDDDWRGR
jgi:hypothetical protein